MPIVRRSTISEAHYSFGDIVWAPFPFVESPRLRDRPALVVNAFQPARGVDLLWVLMITSAANKGWGGDVSLEDCYSECGIQVPCVIRTAKVTTIEARRVRRVGALPDALRSRVRQAIEVPTYD